MLYLCKYVSFDLILFIYVESACNLILILFDQCELDISLYSSYSAFQAISQGFTILGDIFCICDCFLIQPRGSHILSSWMVHAGCVFVAGIDLSRA